MNPKKALATKFSGGVRGAVEAQAWLHGEGKTVPKPQPLDLSASPPQEFVKDVEAKYVEDLKSRGQWDTYNTLFDAATQKRCLQNEVDRKWSEHLLQSSTGKRKMMDEPVTGAEKKTKTAPGAVATPKKKTDAPEKKTDAPKKKTDAPK